MSIVTPPEPLAAPTLDCEPYRLSVDQYLDMVRLGILTEDDRVELLEGVLVAKMSKNPAHQFTTGRMSAALRVATPPGWFVAQEYAVRLPLGVPEPDCVVVRGMDEDFQDRLPEAADIVLVVEVSESSLSRDRRVKARIYARAGLAAYWLVNLVDRRVETFAGPSGPAESPAYASSATYGPEDEIPLVLDGREVGRVPVASILPRAR